MDIKEKISNLSSYVHGFREILRFSRYEKKKIQGLSILQASYNFVNSRITLTFQ